MYKKKFNEMCEEQQFVLTLYEINLIILIS